MDTWSNVCGLYILCDSVDTLKVIYFPHTTPNTLAHPCVYIHCPVPLLRAHRWLVFVSMLLDFISHYNEKLGLAARLGVYRLY